MEKKCIICLKQFEAKNYWQKYCSSKCKQITWALNQLKEIFPSISMRKQIITKLLNGDKL